jgi:mannitol 2-dehydrogenase
VARSAFTQYARRQDPALADWIEQEVRFPSSMVDRITPVTSDADRAEVQELTGVEDGWPVVCEPYTQWVLEDDFVAGRPAFEQVGVQLVPDVRPYELMKLRLLNASHQALGYLGLLAGYDYVHEVARDPLFATFVRAYMDDEATPTLPALPGVDLEDYKSTLVERFANPEVRDTLPRICADTSDRIPTFLLPVTRSCSPPAGTSRCPPSSSPRGRATPRASTSRAATSTWWTAGATADRGGAPAAGRAAGLPAGPAGVRGPR